MSRSKWKGPYIKADLLNKICNKTLNTDVYLASRNSEIMPKCVNHTFQIHNGKKYSDLKITQPMVGHKFGEFVSTRAVFVFKKRKKKKKSKKK